MKKVILAYGLLFLVILVIVILKFNLINVFEKRFIPSYAQIGNRRFSLLLARTEKERMTGLSNTNKLQENQAMLFVFEKKEYYSFWMKNVKFPIDILFINDSTIVDMYENVQPALSTMDTAGLPIYRSKKQANYVLEINGGLAKKTNVKVGNKITIKLTGT